MQAPSQSGRFPEQNVMVSCTIRAVDDSDGMC